LLRSQAEALARTEQKFRAVLEAAPDAMVITDKDGTIQLANSRTDFLFGYPRERLMGLNIASLIPEWRAPNEDGVHRFDSALFETRHKALHRKGTVFPVQITRSPFASEDGLLITTAIRDATEQVQAEERIRRINQELEKRVEERTADLTRSNDALRQFAWAASHDLQEASRMVLTYSQWISRSGGGNLDEQNREKLKRVEENAARLQALLADLRQYIFISEAGDLQFAQVDCCAIIKSATSYLEGMIGEASAEIVCEPLPTIYSIEVLLQQLFQNLISNAIKYRSAKAPRVQISAERQDGCWIFSVQDNGIGIEPEYLDYVFGVFKRLHGRQYSGTGIGLAICRAAVERLGGRIWAESTPGHGSTFHFALPERSAA